MNLHRHLKVVVAFVAVGHGVSCLPDASMPAFLNTATGCCERQPPRHLRGSPCCDCGRDGCSPFAERYAAADVAPVIVVNTSCRSRVSFDAGVPERLITFDLACHTDLPP